MDPKVCIYCGEKETEDNPVKVHVISPPVSGYDYEEVLMHDSCAAEAAEGMVR